MISQQQRQNAEGRGSLPCVIKNRTGEGAFLRYASLQIQDTESKHESVDPMKWSQFFIFRSRLCRSRKLQCEQQLGSCVPFAERCNKMDEGKMYKCSLLS
jgi:hypothetical protein